MPDEIEDAVNRAVRDERVRVMILRGAGPRRARRDRRTGRSFRGLQPGSTGPAAGPEKRDPL